MTLDEMKLIGMSQSLAEIKQQIGALPNRGLEDYLKMNNEIAFPYGVGLVAFRFDDNDKSFYDNAYPLLRDRAFPATLSYVANKIGAYPTRAKCTDTDTITMCQTGFELGCHSYSHLDIPKTIDEMIREVAQAKSIYESTTGFKIKNYLEPGTWSEHPAYGSTLANLIQAYFAYYEGYIGSDTPNRPNESRWGVTHKTLDDVVLATMEGWIDQVAGSNKAMIMMTHHVGSLYSGITTANFQALLDYIKTKRDVGQLEVVTDRGLLAAKIGSPFNSMLNGSFQYGSNGMDGYILAGTPTVTTYNSDKVCNLTMSNYIKYKMDIERSGNIYRVSFDHRTDSTGTMRLMTVFNPGLVVKTAQAVSSSTWKTLEYCVQFQDTSTLELWFQPAAGNVMIRNIKLTRIG